MFSIHNYGIFSDSLFIRKNTLINHLHSNFPAESFQLVSTRSFSDLLRAYYHSLSLEKDQKAEKESLSLIFSLLTTQADNLCELDWFYCERILLHFSNQNKSIPNQIHFLLNRW